MKPECTVSSFVYVGNEVENCNQIQSSFFLVEKKKEMDEGQTQAEEGWGWLVWGKSLDFFQAKKTTEHSLLSINQSDSVSCR